MPLVPLVWQPLKSPTAFTNQLPGLYTAADISEEPARSLTLRDPGGIETVGLRLSERRSDKHPNHQDHNERRGRQRHLFELAFEHLRTLLTGRCGLLRDPTGEFAPGQRR